MPIGLPLVSTTRAMSHESPEKIAESAACVHCAETFGTFFRMMVETGFHASQPLI
jgi:hypothetical protein